MEKRPLRMAEVIRRIIQLLPLLAIVLSACAPSQRKIETVDLEGLRFTVSTDLATGEKTIVAAQLNPTGGKPVKIDIGTDLIAFQKLYGPLINAQGCAAAIQSNPSNNVNLLPTSTPSSDGKKTYSSDTKLDQMGYPMAIPQVKDCTSFQPTSTATPFPSTATRTSTATPIPKTATSLSRTPIPSVTKGTTATTTSQIENTESNDWTNITIGIICIAVIIAGGTMLLYRLNSTDAPVVPIKRPTRERRTIRASSSAGSVDISHALSDVTGIPALNAVRASAEDGSALVDIMNIRSPAAPSVRKLAQERLIDVLKRLSQIGVRVENRLLVILTERAIFDAIDNAAEKSAPIAISIIVSVDNTGNQFVEGIQVKDITNEIPPNA